MWGLSAHPRVAAQCNLLGSITAVPGQKLLHSSVLWPGLVEVWYRLSGFDQFRSTEQVTQANAKAAKELARLKGKLKKAAKPDPLSSREKHIRHFMRAHLTQECQREGPGFMYNLLCSTATDSDYQLCLSTLEDHVQTGIGQTALKVPAASRMLPALALDEEQKMESAFMETSLPDAVPDVPGDDEEAEGAPVTPCGGDAPAPALYLQDVHFKEEQIIIRS